MKLPIKTWDRDVMCLPKSRQNVSIGGNIKYPRGKYRSVSQFRQLHLTSDMTEIDVQNEITSIFKGPMEDHPNFPFVYIPPAYWRRKQVLNCLSFKWIPQLVARFAGQTGVIYILAQSDMATSDGFTEVR